MLNFNKKYKRIFSFGCSFTSYSYPTWANLIAYSYPTSKFYNFARSGAGNSFISARITEANNKFKFNEDDLILVMWSTFCREDRFLNNKWLTPGNIFSQEEYDSKFIKKFADTKGYLIRDLSTIEITTNYLETLSSDILNLIGVPFNYQNETNDIEEVLFTYKKIIDKFPKSIYELEMNNEWPREIEFYFDWNLKNKTYEYHPHTLNYANYLIKLGIDLPNHTIKYANFSLYKIKRTEYFTKLINEFPGLFKDETNGFSKLMWG
jgi:hypothetical protein